MLIVHDHATGEKWELENDKFARAFCERRWPDAVFAFSYLKDIAIEGENHPRLGEGKAEHIILSVVKNVPEDYEGTVPTFGFVVAAKFAITDVWSDAMYFGALAEEIDADLEAEDDPPPRAA